MAVTDYYVTTDAMGSVMAVLDESGNVLERRSYDAFGAATYMLADGTVVPNSPTGVDIGFQGQLMDELTGMYQMGFRWYSPVLGRWVSLDPIGLIASPNLFTFSSNNPVALADPVGLKVRREQKIKSSYTGVKGVLTYDVYVSDICPDVEVQNFRYEESDRFAPIFVSSFSIQIFSIFGIGLYSQSEREYYSRVVSSNYVKCGDCLFKMKKVYEVTVIMEEALGTITIGLHSKSMKGVGIGIPTGFSLYSQKGIEYQTLITVESECMKKC